MPKLAAGNWKMNGTGADLGEIDALVAAHPAPGCEVLICPPATLIARMAAKAAGSAVMVGGQDCHAAASGAHTGDISAAMLAEAGAGHVILGHSERRADHGETDAEVRAKTCAAWDAGLVAIVCVGETLDEREAGQTLAVVGGQLEGSLPDGVTAANTVVAYEPVWAIGTGKVATPEQAQDVHALIRSLLTEMASPEVADGIRIQYGGSVKAGNAADLAAQPDIDGALVGGASLEAEGFLAIAAAFR